MSSTPSLQISEVDLLKYAVELEQAEDLDWREVLSNMMNDFEMADLSCIPKLTQEQKDALVKDVTIHVLKGLRETTISFDEVSSIASFILDSIDRMQTAQDVGDFLFLLKSKYPAFESFQKIAELQSLPSREQIEVLAQTIK